MKRFSSMGLAVLGLTFTSAALATSPATSGAKPVSQLRLCVTYTNASVMRADGSLVTGRHLTIGSDGTIVHLDVKPGLAPPGCKVTTHTTPVVITPGLVETTSSIGLVEIWLEDAPNDASAVKDDQGPLPFRASYRAFDAFNPRSTLIPIARAEGISHVVTVPRGGLISGQAPAMRLRGRLQADAAVSQSAAMVARLGGAKGSRAFRLQALTNLLDEARRYLGAKGKKGDRALPAPVGVAGHRGTPQSYYTNLEALEGVLTAKQPLLVFADRASDLEALLRLKKRFGIRLVIAGAAEGWLVAGELAAAKVPVIIDPTRYRPGSFDQLHARVDNASRLHKAGVPIIIGTFSTHDARRLRQWAGNAVRGGLPAPVARRAITTTPAEFFGLPVNQLKQGGVANLAIWDGDPLEPRSSLRSLWIDGVPARLDTRHKQLLRRYLRSPQQRGLKTHKLP